MPRGAYIKPQYLFEDQMTIACYANVSSSTSQFRYNDENTVEYGTGGGSSSYGSYTFRDGLWKVKGYSGSTLSLASIGARIPGYPQNVPNASQRVDLFEGASSFGFDGFPSSYSEPAEDVKKALASEAQNLLPGCITTFYEGGLYDRMAEDNDGGSMWAPASNSNQQTMVLPYPQGYDQDSAAAANFVAVQVTSGSHDDTTGKNTLTIVTLPVEKVENGLQITVSTAGPLALGYLSLQNNAADPAAPAGESNLPSTGDSANLPLWAFMMGAALAGMLTLTAHRKRSVR